MHSGNGAGDFHKPVVIAFLVWVTRQHDDALVTLCGLKLVKSSLRVGNLIEVFQHSAEDWALANAHVDNLTPGSAEESDLIHIGFLEVTGFDSEAVSEIRKQLSI